MNGCYVCLVHLHIKNGVMGLKELCLCFFFFPLFSYSVSRNRSHDIMSDLTVIPVSRSLAFIFVYSALFRSTRLMANSGSNAMMLSV